MLFIVSLLAASGSRVASAQTAASAQTQDAFFNDDTLQEVRLVLSSRDWQALKANFDQNTYYAADLTWNGVTVRNVGIRSRGNATRNGVKPGLRVDINRYVSNQEFLGLKAVILDNMYSDSSLVRESVTMNDRTFVGRVFGAQEAQVESGGYLFEYQYLYPYHFEYLGPDLEAYAALFKPETRETDSIVNIYGPLEAMIRTINEAPDDQFADAVSKHIDMPLLMKYLAVETFMVEWDGLVGFVSMNNFYLYRSRQTGRAQLIPKDKDASLAFTDIPIMFRLDTNVLIQRAMDVPEFRQIYLDTLSQCVNLAQEPGADDARGWLEREIDRQTSQITTAVGEDPAFPYSFDEFLSVVESLLEFARARPPFVSCEATERAEVFDTDTDCAIVTADATATGRIFALGTSRRKR